MEQMLEAAFAHIRPDELRRIATEMTAIPSPSGDEAPLAEYLVAELRKQGLESALQPVADRQANAVGRLGGDGSGPDLLLYAPIDMHMAGNPANDVWIDFTGRDDLVPKPAQSGDYVIGFGSENPKGHGACVLMAAAAIAKAGIPLRGTLIAGFGSGGMPVNRSPDPAITRENVAHGVGCAYMLEHGVEPDFAVIAKPGDAVAYEEVGLCWFELVVRGDYSYAGIGQRPDRRYAVLDAATVVTGLSAWFPDYTKRNTSGLVAPKGSVSAIVGGWPEKPAFTPSFCKIYLDLRISPRTSPPDAHAQLDAALEAIRKRHPGLDVASRMIVAIPGTSTPPENWIVRSAIKAWEQTSGRTHEFKTGTSGATDANILRRYVPTARVGMAPVPAGAPHAGTFSMGVVSVTQMVGLTRSLVAIALDTCTRTRTEVGLS
jgi:acetylornithine deacetylase/succinyl-diaminopimelate desuccinylase-like protein